MTQVIDYNAICAEKLAQKKPYAKRIDDIISWLENEKQYWKLEKELHGKNK